jgi:hypothetical protein
MRRCGCAIVNVGLESANDRVLNLMRKGYRVGQAAQLLENAAAAGMPVHLYCICGFPGETEDESRATLAFLRQHAPSCHSVYFQDYAAQLAAKVFAEQLGSQSRGLPAARMIGLLREDPAIGEAFACRGNLIRRRGYPIIEDHNFLYLANQHLFGGETA